jgi:hypothetical protein
MKLAALLFLAVGTASGQTYFNAPPMIGLVSDTGGGPYSSLATTGTAGPSYDNAQPFLLLGLGADGKYHVCGTANPCTGGGGGGGGGATIPSTTNLINGDGAGNGADSGIVPANVATLSGTQTFTGAKTFPGATFTDKVSATSSSATTTVSTLNVTNNETGGSFMVSARVLAPNMGNNHTSFIELGQVESTNNSFLLAYARSNLGGTFNRFSIQPFGEPIAFSIFASGNTNIGTAVVDSGFKLDVQGSFRAVIPGTTLGTALASAGTIAPIAGLMHITGTAAIATITPPTGFIGCMAFIADGAWTTTTAGNIQAAMTAVAGTAYRGCFDGTKWFIS